MAVMSLDRAGNCFTIATHNNTSHSIANNSKLEFQNKQTKAIKTTIHSSSHYLNSANTEH